MTREEILHLSQSKDASSRMSYPDFQKTILDFQLQEHEKFLFRFTQIFKEVDSDNNGIINEEEFRELITKLQVVGFSASSRGNNDEIMYMLQMIDPYNNQRMTFSEVVHLLSSHMVPLDESNPSQMIPLLEKFVNRTSAGGNFQDIELEMQQRHEH